MIVQDLGQMAYRAAWAAQDEAHAAVVAGGDERVLLVEHPAVITFGRRSGQEKHLLASSQRLGELGVEVVHSDRGGDVTFHGLGQLVAYPIVRLIDHRLSVGGFVHRLEDVVLAVLAELGVTAHKDPAAIGLWVQRPGQAGESAKICALGVRVRRGVSLHGIALNVKTDLRYFELIVPCGLVDRTVTSLQQLLGPGAPDMAKVKEVLARQMCEAFAMDA